jgi:FkbM family methyltransferase
VRNIARYLAWQLRSRLGREPRVFEFANGSKMLAQKGMTGATGNLYVGLQEFEEMSFALHYLRQEDLFVDVGANVGSYTILASAGVGSEVLAFEPGGEAFAWLVRNIELNGVSERVEARCEAAGASAGTASFTSGLDTINRIDPQGSVTVPVTTVDALCGRRNPALIKIDVEGREKDVLVGAASVLSGSAPLAVLIEHPVSTDLLRSVGFACYTYDPFKRTVTPRAEDSSGIFIRGIEHARYRLEHAPAFSIRGWHI